MTAPRNNVDQAGPDDAAARTIADSIVRKALLELHQELLGFLMRRLGNRAEAEEVMQRFSLRAVERASDLRDIRTVRRWLGRILATTIADHQREAIRRRRREVAMEPQVLKEASEAQPDPEIDRVVCECLHKLLPTLKSEYADVIRRADIVGETREHIAASLGMTLNNVTVRLSRARQALRKRLEEMCLTCPVHGFFDCQCDEARRTTKLRAKAALAASE